MTHGADRYAGERLPDIRGVLAWVVLTWASACVGVVLTLLTGNWVALLYAINSAVLAAGYFLAVHRWVTWRALAEAATELGIRRVEDDNGPA